MTQEKNKDSLIRYIAIAVLSLLGITILTTAFFSNNYGDTGPSMMSGMHGMDTPGVINNGGFSSIIGSLFSVIIQLFWVLVLVAFVLGIFLLFKRIVEQNKTEVQQLPKLKNYHLQSCPECGSKISDEFKFCPVCTAKLIEECSQCHRKIQWAWQCCPYCGTLKEAVNREDEKEQTKKEEQSK